MIHHHQEIKTCNCNNKKSAAPNSRVEDLIVLFTESFRTQDFSQFESYLSEELEYDELNKWEVLQKLQEHAGRYKRLEGYPQFDVREGNCPACYDGAPVIEFYHPEDGRWLFAYYLKAEGGEVADFKRCLYSSGWQKENPGMPF